MRMKTLIVGAIVSASMLLAAPAFAQTASQGYSKPSGSVAERISTENTPNPPHDPPAVAVREQQEARSELPFTGRDIGLIVAAGGVLLAMGLGMRRLSRAEVA